MTGVERLRALAGAWDEWGLGGALAEVADEIERERDAEVADSPYDAILPEDRDAIAWVREHGGLDHVRTEWRSRVPYDRYERRRQNLLRHIAECETALGRRRQRIEELGHRVSDLTNENAELRKRAMPEGYEWPRYESGEPVGFGDDVSRHGEDFEANVIALYRDGSFSLNFWAYSKGERVKRPAVLAADGEPLEVGQTVWDVLGNRRFKVLGFSSDAKLGEFTVKTVGIDGMSLEGYSKPSDLTHQRPVLDADGVPCKIGDMVWDTENGSGFIVLYVAHDSEDGFEGLASHTVLIKAMDRLGFKVWSNPKTLTHTKPEPPKRFCRDCAYWQKDPTADNMGVCWFLYHEYEGQDCYSARLSDIGACEEFMPSARALAERERGE